MNPILKTERLVLRSPDKTDARYFFEARRNIELNQYIERLAHKDLIESEAFVQNLMDMEERGECFYRMLCLIGGKNPIGTLCLWNFSEDKKTAEIGFELFKASQKQGYMAESVNELLRYAFKELKLESILAYTHPKNEDSKKLLTHMGFVEQRAVKPANNNKDFIFELRQSYHQE